MNIEEGALRKTAKVLGIIGGLWGIFLCIWLFGMFISWTFQPSYEPEDGLLVIFGLFVITITAIGIVGSFLVKKHPGWAGSLQFIAAFAGLLFFPFWIPATILFVTGSIFAWRSI
jgi:hypothetical protein